MAVVSIFFICQQLFTSQVYLTFTLDIYDTSKGLKTCNGAFPSRAMTTVTILQQPNILSQPRTKIAYYISSHGYGHQTRALPLLSSLTRAGIHVVVCTAHPIDLFPADLMSPGNPLCEYRHIDSTLDGVLQKDPLTLDTEGTISHLAECFERYKEWTHRESCWLTETGISVILTDSSFAPGFLSKKTKIPSFLLGNFAWDSLYLDWLPAPILDWVRSGYKEFRGWLRLPGWINTDSFQNHRLLDWNQLRELKHVPSKLIMDFPPLARFVQHDSALVKQYDSSTTCKYLFIGFGGQKSRSGDQASELSFHRFLNSLPDDWTILVGAFFPFDHPRLIKVASDVYYPDLMARCHVVIGKLGYGTVSECIQAGTPIIYFPRKGFELEEEALLNWLHSESIYTQKIDDFSQLRADTLEVALGHKKRDNRTVQTAFRSCPDLITQFLDYFLDHHQNEFISQ